MGGAPKGLDALMAAAARMGFYPAHSTNAHLNPMIAHTLGKVAMPDKDEAEELAAMKVVEESAATTARWGALGWVDPEDATQLRFKPGAVRWPDGTTFDQAAAANVHTAADMRAHLDKMFPPSKPAPPSKPEPPTTVLDEAADIIVGERADDYGSAVTSFGRIAALWSAYLGAEVTGHDVSQLMILMKASRARGGYHHDSAVDIAGYAALSQQLHQAADDALGSYNTADKEEG